MDKRIYYFNLNKLFKTINALWSQIRLKKWCQKGVKELKTGKHEDTNSWKGCWWKLDSLSLISFKRFLLLGFLHAILTFHS